MAGSSTYIVTEINTTDGITLGRQHIRQDFESAVDEATKMAFGRTTLTTDIEEIRAGLTASAGWYEDDWAIVIGNPDTEE